jgi:hypothetical protein
MTAAALDWPCVLVAIGPVVKWGDATYILCHVIHPVVIDGGMP